MIANAKDHDDALILEACLVLEIWGGQSGWQTAQIWRAAVARSPRTPPMFSDADYRMAIDADMPELHSPQSTARDFGDDDRRSGLGVVVLTVIAAMAVAGFFAWLFLRGITTAQIDAETARAMARAYLEGM